MPEQVAEEIARSSDDSSIETPRWIRPAFWGSVMITLVGLLLALVVDGAFAWLFYTGLAATAVSAGCLVLFRGSRPGCPSNRNLAHSRFSRAARLHARVDNSTLAH